LLKYFRSVTRIVFNRIETIVRDWKAKNVFIGAFLSFFIKKSAKKKVIKIIDIYLRIGVIPIQMLIDQE